MNINKWIIRRCLKRGNGWYCYQEITDEIPFKGYEHQAWLKAKQLDRQDSSDNAEWRVIPVKAREW